MILDGKTASQNLFENIKVKLSTLSQPLKLVALQVGNNPASTTYINLKRKKLTSLGIDFEHIKFEENASELEIKTTIQALNKDDSVTGILLQLPLPEGFNARELLDSIDPNKDPDCLTSKNLGKFFVGESHLIPATPLGIIRILNHYNIEIAGKNVCIVGRSNIVGKPLAIALTQLNATVTLCHSKTNNLAEKTKSADIVVAAIGKAKFFTKEYFSPNQTVIDVGINTDENGKICGDVDFENVNQTVENITPVPGGIGPMTIYGLTENLVNL